jgi:Ser-tRNA(Ala) deacylase AlaX
MWEKARIETIENSYKNNTKLFFEKSNEIKNGFKPRSTIMKDDEGTLITNKEKVTKEFKKVFKEMLNVSTRTETSDDNIVIVEQYLEEPSSEEVKMAVEMLKGGKAPREDSIMLELLKK